MNFNGGNILKNLELYVSYGKINKTGNYKKIYEKKSDSFVYQFHKLLVSLFANNSITSIKGVDLFNIFFRYPWRTRNVTITQSEIKSLLCLDPTKRGDSLSRGGGIHLGNCNRPVSLGDYSSCHPINGQLEYAGDYDDSYNHNNNILSYPGGLISRFDISYTNDVLYSDFLEDDDNNYLYWKISKTFTNISSITQTIHDITLWSVPTQDSYNSDSGVQFNRFSILMARDLLSSPFILMPDDNVTINYEIRINKNESNQWILLQNFADFLSDLFNGISTTNKIQIAGLRDENQGIILSIDNDPISSQESIPENPIEHGKNTGELLYFSNESTDEDYSDKTSNLLTSYLHNPYWATPYIISCSSWIVIDNIYQSLASFENYGYEIQPILSNSIEYIKQKISNEELIENKYYILSHLIALHPDSFANYIDVTLRIKDFSNNLISENNKTRIYKYPIENYEYTVNGSDYYIDTWTKPTLLSVQWLATGSDYYYELKIEGLNQGTPEGYNIQNIYSYWDMNKNLNNKIIDNFEFKYDNRFNSGIINNSLLIDNNFQRIKLLDSEFIGQEGTTNNMSYTYSFWIKPLPPSYNFGTLFYKENSWKITIETSDIDIDFFKLNFINSTNPVISIDSLSYNTWYYIVITLDYFNNICKIFKNGIEEINGYVSSTGFTNDLFVGTEISTPSNFDYSGSLDETSIWKRILTDEEILDSYNSGSGRTYISGSISGSIISTNNLISYFKFDSDLKDIHNNYNGINLDKWSSGFSNYGYTGTHGNPLIIKNKIPVKDLWINPMTNDSNFIHIWIKTVGSDTGLKNSNFDLFNLKLYSENLSNGSVVQSSTISIYINNFGYPKINWNDSRATFITHIDGSPINFYETEINDGNEWHLISFGRYNEIGWGLWTDGLLQQVIETYPEILRLDLSTKNFEYILFPNEDFYATLDEISISSISNEIVYNNGSGVFWPYIGNRIKVYWFDLNPYSISHKVHRTIRNESGGDIDIKKLYLQSPGGGTIYAGKLLDSPETIKNNTNALIDFEFEIEL